MQLGLILLLHFREYQNFMELMSRLASAVNVCLSEESVIIGDNGLLTAESLNALQHSGAISVYNTLQMNDWKYPLPDEGEMVVSRPNWSAAEDPGELDKILKSETPALHLTECLVDGDQTELLGGVRPLRGLLPPTLVFRSVAEVEDESGFDTQDVSQPVGECECFWQNDFSKSIPELFCNSKSIPEIFRNSKNIPEIRNCVYFM